MPFGVLTHGSQEPCIAWGPETPRKGATLRGNVVAHCNVPMHKFIVHRWPAAMGERACPAHTVDECICHHEG